MAVAVDGDMDMGFLSVSGIAPAKATDRHRMLNVGASAQPLRRQAAGHGHIGSRSAEKQCHHTNNADFGAPQRLAASMMSGAILAPRPLR